MNAAINRILGPGEKVRCKTYYKQGLLGPFRHFYELALGRSEAWNCLHAQTVFFAFRLAGDDFEDLMQSTDITLLLNIRNGKFLFDNKPPKSYYMTLLWNEQQNRNRDKAKRRAEALDDSARVLQVAASYALSIDQLEFFLLQIPPLCRALIAIHNILDIDDKYFYKSIIAYRQSSEDLEKIMNELAQNIIAKQPLFSQDDIEALLQGRGLLRFGKTNIANIRVKRNECKSALSDLIINQYI